jgi:hypothetical protein
MISLHKLAAFRWVSRTKKVVCTLLTSAMHTVAYHFPAPTHSHLKTLESQTILKRSQLLDSSARNSCRDESALCSRFVCCSSTPQINSLLALPTLLLSLRPRYSTILLHTLTSAFFTLCLLQLLAFHFSPHFNSRPLFKLCQVTPHGCKSALHSLNWFCPTRSPLTAILQSRPPLLPSPTPMLNNSRRNYSLLTSRSFAPNMPPTIWFHKLCFNLINRQPLLLDLSIHSNSWSYQSIATDSSWRAPCQSKQ